VLESQRINVAQQASSGVSANSLTHRCALVLDPEETCRGRAQALDQNCACSMRGELRGEMAIILRTPRLSPRQ